MTFLHSEPATEGRPCKKKTNQNVRSRHFEHIYKNIMYRRYLHDEYTRHLLIVEDKNGRTSKERGKKDKTQNHRTQTRHHI